MTKQHPETREGEMYITNCDRNLFFNPEDAYYNIGWKTKRKGIIAYDVHGNIVEDSYPVFIQIEEYKAKYGKVIKWHHSMKEILSEWKS